VGETWFPPRDGAGGGGGSRLSVLVDREGAVATVTVNRPDAMNAVDRPTLEELRDRLRELEVDPAIGVVVLTGAGEKAFVAGADIKYMSGLSAKEALAWGELGHESARLLETMPKPTIAAVNGFALGGGCELALACDLRYAGSTAKFGQPEINLGIIPGWGGTQRLARVCGIGVAKDLVLTGRLIDADEALRVGLVGALHDPPIEKAREVADLLASRSPVALAAAKRALNRVLGGDHLENLRLEAKEFGDLFATADAKEGLTAFAEKREPRFTGQ
jgi:enoyl-CoA hydratase